MCPGGRCADGCLCGGRREEFEHVARPYLQRTVDLTASTLQRAGVRPDQIAGLFTSRSTKRSDCRPESRRRRTGRGFGRCGRTGRGRRGSVMRSTRRWCRSRWSSTTSTPSSATPTSPPRSSTTAAPRTYRWTRCACTSRGPGRGTRSRTRSSSAPASGPDRQSGALRPVPAPGRRAGQAWVEAAAVVAAETGVPITADSVGVLDCDYIDVRGAWTVHGRSPRTAQYWCGRTGASPSAASPRSTTPVRVLRQALSTVLSTVLPTAQV